MAEMEPRNLGLGTPDATAAMVRAVRALANHIETLKDKVIEELSDVEVIRSTDLANAYGKAKRSMCLKGALRISPRIAAVAASEWSRASTVYWQQVEGKWVKGYTSRGGW